MILEINPLPNRRQIRVRTSRKTVHQRPGSFTKSRRRSGAFLFPLTFLSFPRFPRRSVFRLCVHLPDIPASVILREFRPRLASAAVLCPIHNSCFPITPPHYKYLYLRLFRIDNIIIFLRPIIIIKQRRTRNTPFVSVFTEYYRVFRSINLFVSIRFGCIFF